MNVFRINSKHGHIHFGFFYVGWDNTPRLPVNDTECGDERFGLGIGRFYVGLYSDGKWCAGFLNEYGFLD